MALSDVQSLAWYASSPDNYLPQLGWQKQDMGDYSQWMNPTGGADGSSAAATFDENGIARGTNPQDVYRRDLVQQGYVQGQTPNDILLQYARQYKGGPGFSGKQDYLDYVYGPGSSVINDPTHGELIQAGDPSRAANPSTFYVPPEYYKAIGQGGGGFLDSVFDAVGQYGPLAAGGGLMSLASLAGVGASAGAAGSLPSWVSGFDVPGMDLGIGQASSIGGAVGDLSGMAGTPSATGAAGWTSGYDLPMGASAGAGTGATGLAKFMADPMGTLGTNAARELSKLVDSPIRTAGGLLSVLGSLAGRNQIQGATDAAINRMDPFGPSRGQYASQLSALMADPSSITKYPGYKAGLDAVQRSMAAQGYQGSGNMMTALADYGGKTFNDAVTQLSSLAGAGFSPSATGQVALNGYQQSNQALTAALARLGLLFPQ